ncbi:hypothetical protein EV356DRAFT_488785 [Viridothelium virens]|uniref:Phospholipid/glycerol acyltransferase domain-containing protein n=1 Tax=Viridothelium virens TaxID=1048519 RepID=A0A6A6H363_VIRVR|nr:hypothetical protein EV356DRAFT_488785 [Viridothelium virens]
MSSSPGRDRAGLLSKLYITLRGIAIISPWLARLFAADIALSLLLPISVAAPTSTYDIASFIAESVWKGVQRIFTHFNGAQITVSGAQLPRGESAIVVSNHVQWVDFYLIQALALKAGMLGRCRWFAKQQLRWVPFLGWGLWAMGMPLVSRKWTSDQKELERVFQGVKRNSWPIWLISYSEATRYTRAKYAETVTWCKANDRPIPRHTLYPRTRGFIATINQLRHTSHVRAVYDVTIAYAQGNSFMGTPSFWQTISMPRLSDTWKFHVHVERYLLTDLPENDEELAKWLETRWIEKGERLESLRDTLARGQPWPPHELGNHEEMFNKE